VRGCRIDRSAPTGGVDLRKWLFWAFRAQNFLRLRRAIRGLRRKARVLHPRAGTPLSASTPVGSGEGVGIPGSWAYWILPTGLWTVECSPARGDAGFVLQVEVVAGAW